MVEEGEGNWSLSFEGLAKPFESATVTLIKRFISSAFGKIYKLPKNESHELEIPWITEKQQNFISRVVKRVEPFCSLVFILHCNTSFVSNII